MFTPPMLMLVVAPPPLAHSTLLHDTDFSPCDLADCKFLVFIIMYIGYIVNNAIISFLSIV